MLKFIVFLLSKVKINEAQQGLDLKIEMYSKTKVTS